MQDEIPLEIDITEHLPIPDQERAIELANAKIEGIIEGLKALLELIQSSNEEFSSGEAISNLQLSLGLNIIEQDQRYGTKQRLREKVTELIRQIQEIAENIQFSPTGRSADVKATDIYQENILPKLNQLIESSGVINDIETPELIKQEQQLIGLIKDIFGPILALARQNLRRGEIIERAGEESEIKKMLEETVADAAKQLQSGEYDPDLINQARVKILEFQQILSNKNFTMLE
jgi:hypothetical protein